MRLLVVVSIVLGACSAQPQIREPAAITAMQPPAAAGLIIMRHGQSDHNVSGTFNSRPENTNYVQSNLTQTGREQVVATSHQLAEQGLSDANVRAIDMSPLPRAQQTAAVLADQLHLSKTKLHSVDTVIEVNMGDYENQLESAFIRKYGENNYSQAHSYHGETNEDVSARMIQFINRILSECKKDSNVVVVTHGTPSRLLLEYLRGPTAEGLKTAGFVWIPWAELYSRSNAPKCD